jgi:hypothetical protein
MTLRIGTIPLRVAFGMILLAAAAPAGAQLGYPSFQQPRIVSREFNFAVADADDGPGDLTPLVFQWREGTTSRSQLSADFGIADPDFPDSDLFIIIGGQYGRELARSRPDMPLDLLLTAGVFTEFGNDITLISIPVGLSVGHRFPLEGTQMAITPYAHPRVSIDHIESDPVDDTEVNINFDLGGNLEITPQIAIRLSATLGDAESLGISLAWTPRGLRPSGATVAPPR